MAIPATTAPPISPSPDGGAKRGRFARGASSITRLTVTGIFEAFARYTLQHADDGRLAARGRKVSFCLIDSARTSAVPDSVAGEETYSSCGADATQGISAGWYDRYGAGLPGQSIDLRGVAPGRYRLVMHADYENRLVERDEGNNRTVLLVDLRADSLGGIGRAAVVR